MYTAVGDGLGEPARDQGLELMKHIVSHVGLCIRVQVTQVEHVSPSRILPDRAQGSYDRSLVKDGNILHITHNSSACVPYLFSTW